MTLLDLLGMLAFLGTSLALLMALVAILIYTIRRRWRGVRRTSAGVAIVLATYAAALLLAALFSHDRLLARGQERCFDDWCVAVVNSQPFATSSTAGTGNDLLIATLHVSSQAKRISQHPSDPRFWVEDRQGRRYYASPAGQAAWEQGHGPARPIDDLIGPGESFDTTLVFGVPATAPQPMLVLAEGPTWIGRIIIGSEDSPFHGRTKVPLSEH